MCAQKGILLILMCTIYYYLIAGGSHGIYIVNEIQTKLPNFQLSMKIILFQTNFSASKHLQLIEQIKCNEILITTHTGNNSFLFHLIIVFLPSVIEFARLFKRQRTYLFNFALCTNKYLLVIFIESIPNVS